MTWWSTHLQRDLEWYCSFKLAEERGGHHKGPALQDLYNQLDTLGRDNIYHLTKSHNLSMQDTGHVQIKGIDKILKDPSAILQWWSIFLLPATDFPYSPILSSQSTFGPAPFTTEEVMMAPKKMKNGRAPGPDDVPADIWKLLGWPGVEFRNLLFNLIIVKKKPPSTTVPIWKGKVDVTECNNYQPIRLLSYTLWRYGKSTGQLTRKYCCDITTKWVWIC